MGLVLIKNKHTGLDIPGGLEDIDRRIFKMGPRVLYVGCLTGTNSFENILMFL